MYYRCKDTENFRISKHFRFLFEQKQMKRPRVPMAILSNVILLFIQI